MKCTTSAQMRIKHVQHALRPHITINCIKHIPINTSTPTDLGLGPLSSKACMTLQPNRVNRVRTGSAGSHKKPARSPGPRTPFRLCRTTLALVHACRHILCNDEASDHIASPQPPHRLRTWACRNLASPVSRTDQHTDQARADAQVCPIRSVLRLPLEKKATKPHTHGSHTHSGNGSLSQI